MSERQGSHRRRIVTLGAAGVTVVVTAVAAVLLLTGAGLPFVGRPHRVTVSITLTPDAAGTVVEYTADSVDGDLPSSVAVELPDADDARLTGAAATGKRLVYSDVVDGLGNPMPADDIRTGHLTAVHTDGNRLQLTFHVAAVDGRRIVYPVPRSSDVSWSTARVYTANGSLACQADTSRGSRTFAPCPGKAEDEIDGERHSQLRLELTGATPAP